MNINTERLTWFFKREADWPDREIDEHDPAWWTAATVKWRYTIQANVDEQGALSFTASRDSRNEVLDSDGIGGLETKCATLQEAKAIAEQWQAERHGDNEAEFIESGGNTERKQYHQLCRYCGKPFNEPQYQCNECNDEANLLGFIEGWGFLDDDLRITKRFRSFLRKMRNRNRQDNEGSTIILDQDTGHPGSIKQRLTQREPARAKARANTHRPSEAQSDNRSNEQARARSSAQPEPAGRDFSQSGGGED
jgi:hypothetical protein